MNLRLSDRTILRGGYGLFFAFAPNDGVQQTEFDASTVRDTRSARMAGPISCPNWFGTGPSGEGEFGGPKPS